MASTSSTTASANVIPSTADASTASAASASCPAKSSQTNEANDLASEVFYLIAVNASESSTSSPESCSTWPPAKNIIISPLLLEASLALLYLGSDGLTAEQLTRSLHLERFGNNIKMANYYADVLQIATKEMDTKIELCQKLLTNDNLEFSDEFRKIAQKYFQTSVDKCNTHSAEKFHECLNDVWNKLGLPEKQNSELAKASCAAETPPLMSSMLLSACNFKGKWFLPFSAYRSGTYEFQELTSNGNGQQQQRQQQSPAVSMLYDEDMLVKFAEIRELDARVIELPYEHELEASMLIVLPNRRDGLTELLDQLRRFNLRQLTERLQMESVQVLLPKFEIDFECGLRPVLEKLGLSSIFAEEANFKNALKDEIQQIFHMSDMWQRVHIAVSESGTQASSVQVTKPIVIANSTRQKIFRADHPFFFAIRCADVTLFMGQVTTCRT